MHSTRSPGRTAAAAMRACACACVAVAAIAACGSPVTRATDGAAGAAGPGSPAGTSQPAGHRTRSSPAADRSPAASVPACAPSGILVTLGAGSAGVAAGTSFIPLDFTNVSALTCRLGGYPVVTLAGRSGRQLGTAGQADGSLSAEVLVLAAGQTAHAWLRLADVMNLPAPRCQPVAASGLRVALPGQAPGTFVSDALTTCREHVRGTDVLVVEPFRPGRARPGTAG